MSPVGSEGTSPEGSGSVDTSPAGSGAGTRAELVARLTAPGGLFELVDTVVGGVPMRVYAGGPATLRELALASAAFGDRDFLVYESTRVSFAEHARTVAGLARCLLEEYGLRPGERVAVAMRNYPEWAPIWYAALVAGLVVVPLNAWWTADELHYALADCGARLVFADAERAALIAPELADLGGLPLVEVRGTGPQAKGVRSWAELVASLDPAATVPDVEVSPGDDATILYTSGTTGRPKGAVATHRNHCTNVLNMRLGAVVSAALANGGQVPVPDPAAPQPGTLCTFPMFHIAGINALCGAAYAGTKLVTLYRWDRELARELIRRERLTLASGVPTTMRQLVEDAAEDPAPLATLASIGMGAAPIPPELVRRIGGTFDRLISPTNGYGLTETTSAVTTNIGADYLAHPDSVGRLVPTAEVLVVDPGSGDPVPEGEIGELWFRGPNVVRGYWNNPGATAAAFTDGWFHSGDLGRVEDGWVYVVDRLKDVVIRGGENIYCAEVEAALFEHPSVADVALVGVPDPSLGEEAVAVVVPRPGTVVGDAAASALRDHVAGRLAAFKVPRYVVFRAEPLPRTPTGKVLKRDLRVAVISEVGADVRG
ncbi:MAG TPA: class I adenylate-forming enzyme family protein [Pseudonocardia sp.]|nr:class I adenylate-forming enzyme family protein [Pseudonocardia sp.]